MGCSMANRSTAVSPLSSLPTEAAPMTTLVLAGTVIAAPYLIRARGVSWQGSTERAWMGWHWVNTYGCSPPAVCWGASHCRAVAVGEVW